jgi:phage gp46-like protein
LKLICCEGDPKLIKTQDGVDFNVINGQPDMDTGLQNAVFLSLFTRPNWIGNSLAESEAEKYNADFQQILSRRLDNQTRLDAIAYAKQSLDWMIIDKVVKSISVIAEIPKTGFLAIEIKLEQNEKSVSFIYTINWSEMIIREGAA